MPTDIVLTVSALNRYVKSVIEQDINLKNVFVKGEISNFKNHYASGHWYMTVKDEKSAVKAVMFKGANSALKFVPEDSMSVIIRGHVSLYEATGDYQLYIDDMQPDGTGALALAFEQLKKKLAAQGLFDASHKKRIPRFPERVGVVTSETGAAVRDIINVISRRYPVADIILCPVAVQGEYAAPQICSAIKRFNELKGADVLIVGRGGGSIEDLWAFNEESVARAIYESEIPVISAVGHETDFTICDFVADLRAPTPSAAAELAVPDARELYAEVSGCKSAMTSAVTNRISYETARLDFMKSALQKNSPKNYIENLILRCDSASMMMNNAAKNYLNNAAGKLSELTLRLDAVSPLKILSRGYGVVSKNEKIISDVDCLEKGDEIDVRLKEGTVKCEVLDKWKK